MIFNDDVLYCHIPKTGGISTRIFIKQNLAGACDFFLDDSPFPDEHVPLRDVEKWTDRPLDSFKLVLAVVREPYEQVLSQWVHWRDSYARGGRHVCEMTAAVNPTMAHWMLDPYWHFGYFYEQRRNGLSDQEALKKVFRLSYYPYWLTVDDEFPANLTMVPYANLRNGVLAALAPFLPSKATGFPHKNKSAERDARQYYTPTSMRSVEEHYPWAFEASCPKRNVYDWSELPKESGE